MKAASFFGKALARVLAVNCDMPRDLQHHRAHRLVVRHRNRFLDGRLCRLVRSAQIQTRCRQQLPNFGTRAHRTLEHADVKLAIEILARSKPAFERVLLVATKIEYFHRFKPMAGIEPAWLLSLSI